MGKAKICKEYEIDLMIDDSPEYGNHFQDDISKFVLIEHPDKGLR